MGERLRPDTPQPSKSSPPRAPSCQPRGAQSQHARARAVGLFTGPDGHPPRTHSQLVAGPSSTPDRQLIGRQRAPKPGRPTPRQEVPPRSRHPHAVHSAQSQLATTHAVGLVTGPHAHTPGTHSQWVAGPGRMPPGQAVWRRRAPNPRRFKPTQEAPRPGALVWPRQRAKPVRKSACCGVDDGSPRPHSPHPQPVGSGPRPHAARTGGRAWERYITRTPHTQARGVPPRAPSARPNSAQSKLARGWLWGW